MTFFGEYRGSTGHGREHAGHGHEITPGSQEAGTPHHLHESPKVMLVPMVVLAILAVIGGYIGVPNALWGNNHFDKFLAPVFKVSSEAMPAGTQPGQPSGEAAAERAETGNVELVMTGISVAAAFLGLLLAWLLYHRKRELPEKIAARLGGFYGTVCDKFYVDEIYQALIVGPLVNGSTRLLWRGIDVSGIDATADDSAETARGISDKLRHMQSGNLRSYAAWISLGAAIAIIYMIWMGAR
jgi:NADH-quinone oxidoreductase subunit L